LKWKKIRTTAFALIFLFNHEYQNRRILLHNFGTTYQHTRLLNNTWANTTTLVASARLTSLWSDFDLSSTVSCGGHRCFVPSVTDGGKGYLVARVEKDTLVGMVKETELAYKMQSQYKAKTFYIEDELPWSVTIPKEIRMKLNAQVRNPLREYRFPYSLGENNTINTFYKESSVIVQKMKAAHNSSLLAHCADNGFTKTQIPNFISKVMDEVEFGANLAMDRYRMYEMLIEMPQLATDLQILINIRGEVYYVDFGGHAAWTEMDKMILTLRPREELCGESYDIILDALNNRDAVMRGEWKWRGRRYQRLRFKAGGMMLSNLADSKY